MLHIRLRITGRVSGKSLSFGSRAPTHLFHRGPGLILQLVLWSLLSSSRRGVQWLLLTLTFTKNKTRLSPSNADGIYTLKDLSSGKVKLKGLKKWKRRTMFYSHAFSPKLTRYKKHKNLTTAKPFCILQGPAWSWQNFVRHHLLLLLIKASKATLKIYSDQKYQT